MGFHDVAFLPSRASFSTIFLRTCGRSETLRTTTVAGVSKGIVPVKYLRCNKSTFCFSRISLRSQGSLIDVIWPLSDLGILPDVEQWNMS